MQDIGGGQFQIDSFFDVWTELSLDGGASWTPSSSATHIVLSQVPEPSAFLLVGLVLVGVGIKKLKRS